MSGELNFSCGSAASQLSTEGLLARSKVAPASRSIAPPAESCVDKSVHCLQEIDVDSAQRSTTLGFPSL